MSVNILVEANEGKDQITLSVKKPSLRYLDMFLGLKCSEELLKLRVYPNAKEITESFAAWMAAKRELYNPGDPDVTALVVGDGSTPRTGALLALMTAWRVFSVDPQLRKWESTQAGKWITRLTIVPCKIEERDPLNCATSKLVFVCVHSHAPLKHVLASVFAKERGLVAIPCCVPQEIPGRQPDWVKQDWGIWSPQRTVKVWRNV